MHLRSVIMPNRIIKGRGVGTILVPLAGRLYHGGVEGGLEVVFLARVGYREGCWRGGHSTHPHPLRKVHWDYPYPLGVGG